MSSEIVLKLTQKDGIVEFESVPIDQTALELPFRELVAVSDNITQLTNVAQLVLWSNAFTEIPASVLAMTQLVDLDLISNQLVALPPEIGRLRALTHIWCSRNMLTGLPREIGLLCKLQHLRINNNAITSLPSELCQIKTLQSLDVAQNLLEWLPHSLARLSDWTTLYLDGNPLPINVGAANSRSKLAEIFAATTWPVMAGIRERAAEILVGLADLELPALVALEILDAALPNSIPMHKKWDLATAVKHFHQRHNPIV